MFNGNRVTMKELATAGAQIDMRNDENKTPVDIAVDKNNKYCVQFLQQMTGSNHPPWLQKLVQNKVSSRSGLLCEASLSGARICFRISMAWSVW